MAAVNERVCVLCLCSCFQCSVMRYGGCPECWRNSIVLSMLIPLHFISTKRSVCVSNYPGVVVIL